MKSLTAFSVALALLLASVSTSLASQVAPSMVAAMPWALPSESSGLVAVADVLRGPYEFEATVAQISLADIVRNAYSESDIGLTLVASDTPR